MSTISIVSECISLVRSSGRSTSLYVSVEEFSSGERTVHVPSDPARGNWESAVVEPFCDRGHRGFQHTLAVSWARRRAASESENSSRADKMVEHAGEVWLGDVWMGSRQDSLGPDGIQTGTLSVLLGQVAKNISFPWIVIVVS